MGVWLSVGRLGTAVVRTTLLAPWPAPRHAGRQVLALRSPGGDGERVRDLPGRGPGEPGAVATTEDHDALVRAAEPGLPADLASALADFETHLAAEVGRSRHTVRAYTADVTLLLARAAAEGIERLDELDLTLLRGWLAQMTASGLARATMARRASSARAFTAWCVRTGRTSTDPAVRLVAPKRDRYLPTVLRKDQSAALLDLATVRADDRDPTHLRDRAALELLYGTGIRVAELVGLDVDDVDLGRNVLRVLGKGAKERTVPFGLPAARAVRDWLDHGRPRLTIGRSGPALAARPARRKVGPAPGQDPGAPVAQRGRRRRHRRSTRSPSQRGDRSFGRRS